MPRREQPLQSNGDPIVEFAIAMRAVREHSKLPYRKMVPLAKYSHVQLQRAANGKWRPAWELALAFLDACGASDDEKRHVKRLWLQIPDAPRGGSPEPNSAVQANRPAARVVAEPAYVGISDDTASDMLALQDLSTAFSISEKHLGPIGVSVERDAIRRGSLRSIRTRVAFGDALRRFTEREGFTTYRELAAFIEESFVDVGAWFSGRPTADPKLIDLIFEKLGFELKPELDREVKEFTDAVKRIESKEVAWYLGLRGQDRVMVAAIRRGTTLSAIAVLAKTDERTARDHLTRLHRACGTTNLAQLAETLELIWGRSGSR